MMAETLLADLFCGAGGAAKGYADAGFTVIGFDHLPQPNYPYEFHQLSAFDVDLTPFAAVHASPPCQFASAYRRRAGVSLGALNLIPRTRVKLLKSNLPYVIENVEQAEPHLRDPIRLCGSTFGLDIRRHRLFEANFPLVGAPCNHAWQTPRFPPATNRTNLRSTVEIGAYRTAHLSPAAMEIDWMTNTELSQAIPPRYTRFIGDQLAAHLRTSS